MKINGHDIKKVVQVSEARRLAKALETTQAQSEKHYRGMLRWMAYTKVKHDALSLLERCARENRDPGPDGWKQIDAALNQNLEVEGEEQWLARTIMLTEAVDQYLKIMGQDDPDQEAMQKAFLQMSERSFVFMPAELAGQSEEKG